MPEVTITTTPQSLATLATAAGSGAIVDGSAYYGQNQSNNDIYIAKASSAPSTSDGGARIVKNNTFSSEDDDDALWAWTDSGESTVYLWA